MATGVTFVTALYLPSTPLYKQVNTYISHFERLASSGVPIILFMDERLKEQGDVLCQRFPNIEHCVYGLLDRRWISDDNKLPTVRNVQKDSADYFCIQLSKLKVLAEAAPLAKTTHLAWIDFGIFHVFQDKHLCHYWLNKIAYSHFPSKSIFVPGCWPMGSYDIWNAICWRFCGGFLLGAKDLFEPAYQTQTRLIMEHLPKLTWEVNYWVMMEPHFTYYDADHNESLLAKVCHYTCP